MRILAVLTVRNEAAFLLEWLAHHRAVGITDFLVYSNNCQDGTDEMLDQLHDMGWLTHERNDGPYDKRGIQFTALKSAENHPLVKAADWILPLDVDEFVNVHVGNHTLPALIDALPEADAITLTWRLFGNCGQIEFQDAPIAEAFTKAAPTVLHWPWRAAMFKTLYRNNGNYAKLGVHRPRQPQAESIKWFDGSGRELNKQFRNKRIFSDFGQDNYGLVQLNHYPLGAMESYVVKTDRGRAVHDADKLGMDYWVERNFNDEEDTSILRTKPERDRILSSLLAENSLQVSHNKAVAWRHERSRSLMHEETNRALFGRLLMTTSTLSISREKADLIRAHRLRELTLGQD